MLFSLRTRNAGIKEKKEGEEEVKSLIKIILTIDSSARKLYINVDCFEKMGKNNASIGKRVILFERSWKHGTRRRLHFSWLSQEAIE